MTKPASCSNCPAFHEPCLQQPFTGDPQANLVVIGGSPDNRSIVTKRAFGGRDGILLKGLLRKYAPSELKVAYTYAALVGVYKPKVSHFNSCAPLLRRGILQVRPTNGRLPVLLTLGPEATKAVGVSFDRIMKAAGRTYEVIIRGDIESKKYTVVPCLSMSHLRKTPGVAMVAVNAIKKAARLALNPVSRRTREEEAENFERIIGSYRHPSTVQEIRELVEEITAYTGDPETPPEHWPIALDTETNTVRPYVHENPKTLMLSVAWDRGKSASVVMRHPDNPVDYKELQPIIDQLLSCKKPKIFQNWKFDYQFLEKVEGYRVERVAWDTMLGEHYLDEDKKGAYSLKTLTTDYCDEYTGYADELQTQHVDGGAVLHYTDAQIPAVTPPKDAGVDPVKWRELVDAILKRQEIKRVAPRDRDKALTKEYTEVGRDIKRLRKELKIEKPVKGNKGNNAQGGFEHIALSRLRPYAAVDTDVTLIIGRAQLQRLTKTNDFKYATSVMKNLYLKASRVLSDMEFRGFKVYTELLAQYKQEIGDKLEDVKFGLSLISPNLNPNAPEQISREMSKLNFEPIEGVALGSTDKQTLGAYMAYYDQQDVRYKFADLLLRYRAYHKTYDTNLVAYEKLSEADGKIHTSFNLNGTATGRLSSSSPNLQNVPLIAARIERNGVEVDPGYNIKKLFIPSDPDKVIVNCDISGAEIRVFTAYSNDKLIIEALNEGRDLHSMVTSKVFGLDYEFVRANKDSDPDIHDKRTACKRVLFGTLYGGGPETIAAQINSTYEEAKEIQGFLFKAFPSLPDYVRRVSTAIERDGRIRTLFGRYRRFPLAHTSYKQMSKSKREAVNFLIQSTASDIVLSQLCEMSDNFDELDASMLITVHDSMVFEMPRKNLPKLRPFLDHWVVQRVAEKFKWLPVAFAYDVEVGPSYGEVKGYDEQEEE